MTDDWPTVDRRGFPAVSTVATSGALAGCPSDSGGNGPETTTGTLRASATSEIVVTSRATYQGSNVTTRNDAEGATKRSGQRHS